MEGREPRHVCLPPCPALSCPCVRVGAPLVLLLLVSLCGVWVMDGTSLPREYLVAACVGRGQAEVPVG